MFRFIIALSAALLVTQPALAKEEFNISGFKIGMTEEEFLKFGINKELIEEVTTVIRCGLQVIELDEVLTKMYSAGLGPSLLTMYFYKTGDKYLLHSIYTSSRNRVSEKEVIADIENNFEYDTKEIVQEHSYKYTKKLASGEELYLEYSYLSDEGLYGDIQLSSLTYKKMNEEYLQNAFLDKNNRCKDIQK